MVHRSRRSASELAMERLKVPLVSDEDLLDVLRLWHFQTNRTRMNVFPSRCEFYFQTTSRCTYSSTITQYHPIAIEDYLPYKDHTNTYF